MVTYKNTSAIYSTLKYKHYQNLIDIACYGVNIYFLNIDMNRKPSQIFL